MLVLSGEVHHLAHLRLRHLVCKYPAFTDAVVVDVEHDAGGTFTILLKKTLEDMNDKFHGCVIIIQEQHAVEIGLLGLWLRARDDRGSAISVVPVPFAVVLHPDRLGDHFLSFLDHSGGPGRRDYPPNIRTTNLVHPCAILSPSFHTAITFRPVPTQRHRNWRKQMTDVAKKEKTGRRCVAGPRFSRAMRRLPPIVTP